MAAQAQIFHWRGDVARRSAGPERVRHGCGGLRACQRTAPESSPSLTVDKLGETAAVISGPTILHEYLVANPDNSTVTELALWSAAPPLTPWPALTDTTVLDALAAPLCARIPRVMPVARVSSARRYS